MSFARNLNKMLKNTKTSQTELAKAINKSPSAISQYLSGTNVPRINVQQKIADVLCCTVEDLNAEDSIQSLKTNNISIKEAAKRLGKSEQFIRVALQKQMVSFGFAVQNKGKWSYHISPKKLNEYIGE